MLQVFPGPVEAHSYTGTKVTYSLAFAYSMVFTNFSLTFISYPTQALAKSCKILPTMLGSLFVKEVHYHPLQYLSVAMITLGTLIFNYNNKKQSGSDSVIGIALLVASLAADSLTSYYNEQVRRSYRPSSLQSMRMLCGFGVLCTAPLLILLNLFVRERSVFSYLGKFPEILNDILVFGVFSAIGQVFIFWGLKIAGSLTLIIITTTRKFVTVIASIVIFNHFLTGTQWICMVLVFAGAILDLIFSHSIEKSKIKQ